MTDDFDNPHYAKSAADQIFEGLSKNKKMENLGNYNQILVYLERQIAVFDKAGEKAKNVRSETDRKEN